MTAAANAQEAIAVLIDLAQRGEIDPWDVQVIEVIDRYLSKLVLTGDSQENTGETDLSQSGQAFLWASMLVLLKADTLANQSSLEEDLELTDADADLDIANEYQLPLRLERQLRRRPAALPPKRRPVTLQELIAQLQQIAEIEEKFPRHQPKRISQSRSQAARAIVQLAHQENLTEVATQLDQFLTAYWQDLAQEQDWLDLEQLLALWKLASAASENSAAHHPSESASPLTDADSNHSETHDRVGVFWALLLLSAQSKVELSQEEFYQEIKIRAFTKSDNL